VGGQDLAAVDVPCDLHRPGDPPEPEHGKSQRQHVECDFERLGWQPTGPGSLLKFVRRSARVAGRRQRRLHRWRWSPSPYPGGMGHRDALVRHHQRLSDGTLRDTCIYGVTAPEWPTVRSHLSWQLEKPR
jgi:hypothetical protein